MAIDAHRSRTATLTGEDRNVVMKGVPETLDGGPLLSVSSALCIAGDAFDRFGRVLRHLTVGLVDQSVPLRLVGDDPRIEGLALGPVQTVLHRPFGWTQRRRQCAQLVEALSHHPPSVVHALSHESYEVSRILAEGLDADLVWQVTSQGDCDRVAEAERSRVGRFFPSCRAIADVLVDQMSIPRDRVELIRPGTLASQSIACFAKPERAVTILCTSPFGRGSGVDRLIDAVAMMHERGHFVLLFLIGRGRHERLLRGLVRERKLLAHVTFVDPGGDPTQALKTADLFVRPATGDAFAADALEAMGAGLALVTRPDSVCDFFRDGETAVLCEKDSSVALADALERLVRDREYARRIAAGAMEYVRNNHPMSGMAERIAAAYRDLALAKATFSIRK